MEGQRSPSVQESVPQSSIVVRDCIAPEMDSIHSPMNGGGPSPNERNLKSPIQWQEREDVRDDSRMKSPNQGSSIDQRTISSQGASITPRPTINKKEEEVVVMPKKLQRGATQN